MLKILESLADAATGSVDLFTAFLNAGYGASYGKLEYELSKIKRERERGDSERRRRKEKEEVERRIRERYYSFMYKLKRDGLVKKRDSAGQEKKQVVITPKGRRKLVLLKKQQAVALPKVSYLSQRGDVLIIVAFDIPEEERRKRDWLRAVLKSLGFTMVQKSVWVGKIILPEKFIEDLKKIRLVEFVEIFSVTKAGSLKQVV